MTARWRYDWGTGAWHRLTDDGRRAGLSWWPYAHAPGRGMYQGFSSYSGRFERTFPSRSIELWTVDPDPSPAALGDVAIVPAWQCFADDKTLERGVHFSLDHDPRDWSVADPERTWFGEGVDPSEWGAPSPDTAAINDALRTLWIGGAIDTHHSPENDMHNGPIGMSESHQYTSVADAPAAIDTSTTAGKIAVMQAAERGERIESTPRDPRDIRFGSWAKVTGFAWNWGISDYRIATPTPVKTALEEAREFVRDHVIGGNVGGRLLSLLGEMDRAPTVTITDTAYTQKINYSQNMKSGRYRLVRDDE